MQYFSIDFLILYALLGITLFIGLRTGRGIKDIREYATGNKEFTTGALVLTWLATDIAGETILDMSHSIRTEGIIQILTLTGGVGIALLMQGLVFAPQFAKFPDCITMGDVMQTLYRGPSQVLTGILAFLTAVCIAGMEVTVLGLLAEQLLGINFYWGTALGGMLLVIYTVHGGIKSVAYTDILQFLILVIIIPLITVICLQHAGGIKEMLTQVSSAKLAILQHPKLGYYLSLFISLSIFQFSVIDPALMQRILMGRSKQQLRNQFLVVSSLFFAVMLSVLLLGLSSLILFPDDSIVTIIPHVIHNLLPTGLKGLAFAGLFAITMSTFDSFLHAAGLTLVHDVITPMCKLKNKKLFMISVDKFSRKQ